MKSLKKLLSIAMVFGLIWVLASCSSYNFYRDFKSAGADIDTDHTFQALTKDEVKAKREAKEEFLLIVGSSTNTTCVSAITQMYSEFKSLNFEGKANYLSVKSALSTQSEGAEISKILESDIDAGNDGIIFMAFDKNGNIKFSTYSKKNYDDAKKFRIDGNLAFRAIADYIVEMYVKEA